MPIDLTDHPDGVLLPIKVVPGASRTRLMGEWNGRLKIAVAAPPEKGLANAALVDALASALKVRRQQLTVVEGLTSPLKVVRITGLSADEMNARLKR